MPNAEVVIDPVLVTDVMPAGRDVLACGPEPMLEAVRALAPAAQLAWEAPMACGYGACYGCVVEVDGRLERLCVEGPVLAGDMSRGLLHDEVLAAGLPPGKARLRPRIERRRTEHLLLLNASGCLDALTAPETARQLDAFVTKTVTPEPREGNPPVRIAETESRDAERDRARQSRARAVPGRDAARAARARASRCGCRSAASRPRTTRRRARAWRVSRSSSTSRARTSTRRRSRRRRSSPRAVRRPSCRSTRSSHRRPGTSARSRARSRRQAPTGSRSSTRFAASPSTTGCGRASPARRAATRVRR